MVIKAIQRREFLKLSGATVVLPLVPGLAAEGGEPGKVLFRAGLLTDTHIRKDPKTQVLVRKAMELFRREGVDLVCHLGDLADVHDPEGYDGYRRILDETFADRMPEFLYAYGNHDGNGYTNAAGRRDDVACWGVMRERLGITHALCDVVDFRGHSFVISPQNVNFKRLKDDIERAIAAHPGRPVFLLEHVPAWNTVFDSVMWGNRQLRALCDRYPQLVHLSGHTHGTNRHELQIWQGGFTEVNCGCLQRWLGGVANAPIRSNLKLDDGVMTMEMRTDAIVFRRFSLATGAEYRPADPWTVPQPFDPAHAPYDPAVRAKACGAPVWPAGATPRLRWVGGAEVGADGFGGLEVTFAEARHPHAPYIYRAVLFEADGKGGWRYVTLAEGMGEFWQSDESARKGLVAIRFPDAVFSPGGRYRVEVRPRDFLRNVGEAIAAEIEVPATASSWETVWKSDDPMRDVVFRHIYDANALPVSADGFVHPTKWCCASLPAFSDETLGPGPHRLVYTLESRHADFGSWKTNVSDPTNGGLSSVGLLTPEGHAGPVTYVMPLVREKMGPMAPRIDFSYGDQGSDMRLSAVRLERESRVAGSVPPIRIAHLGDPQFGYGRKGPHEEVYAEDLARFERAVEKLNEMKPDIVLVAGDMVTRWVEMDRDWPRLLKRISVPVLVTAGNHDVPRAGDARQLALFKKVFGYTYASVTCGGWRFISGNGQIEAMKRPSPDYIAWRDAELAKAKADGLPTVWLVHQPPDPRNPEHVAFLGKLRDANVRFVLCGHLHRAKSGRCILPVLNAECTSRNGDGRPHGFRLLDVRADGSFDWRHVAV